jgi:lipopolysaccharide export system protein LptA
MVPARTAPLKQAIGMERSRPRCSGERRRPALGAAGALLLAALAFGGPEASAQTAVGGFSSLSSADSKQPIDIESDQLEVDDKRHMAIFSGNVSATQGDNNLKAPRLEVFYDTKGQTATGKAGSAVKAASGPTDPITGGQIKRIHAMGGKVVVTSTKDQQEAIGDDAEYDVKAQQITMTGKEVVLAQGLSKVKGTKLVIDLKTGQAKLIAERVRAIFQQQIGPDGKPLNPLGPLNPAPEPKKTAPAEHKKPAGTAQSPAKKTPAPPKENAPQPGEDWQTQSR